VKIAPWNQFPPAIKKHLRDRLLDRSITSEDLKQLAMWIDSVAHIFACETMGRFRARTPPKF
jgi:hypothetical protein